MNNKQIDFLDAINTAIKQANDSRDRIATALESNLPINEEACLEYVAALDRFVLAGIRMSWECQLIFGENQKTIAESLNLRISEC